MNTGSITSNVVDIPGRSSFPATVTFSDGRITAIEPNDSSPTTYLLPGFIDAHVHVESSMLVPSEFARAAVVHGTVATVSDPHEIGNVLGVAGVEYMLDNAAQIAVQVLLRRSLLCASHHVRDGRSGDHRGRGREACLPIRGFAI